jgi:alpha-beta hydrolase superfamily lysophospholipase
VDGGALAAAEVETRQGTLTSADGTRLFWRAWEVEQPRATFAVVHGLGEHSGRYERFARAMAVRGLSVFAVDLRGMGQSEGRRGHLQRWADWIKDLETFVGMVEEHPSAGEVIPLGHSFGGIVVLSAVIREALMSRRFVVSNPALRAAVRLPGWKLFLGRLSARMLPTLALSNEVDPASISREPAVVEAYRADPLVHDRITARLWSEWQAASEELRARAREIRTPFMLILSEADRLIDPEGARELARLATKSPPLVRSYPDRYHEPFNDLGCEEVFDDLAAWAGAREAATTPAP